MKQHVHEYIMYITFSKTMKGCTLLLKNMESNYNVNNHKFSVNEFCIAQ